MGFFATFSTWLNGMLSTYIGTNTAKIATLFTPAIATLATVYVMVWGYSAAHGANPGAVHRPASSASFCLVVILGGALESVAL